MNNRIDKLRILNSLIPDDLPESTLNALRHSTPVPKLKPTLDDEGDLILAPSAINAYVTEIADIFYQEGVAQCINVIRDIADKLGEDIADPDAKMEINAIGDIVHDCLCTKDHEDTITDMEFDFEDNPALN